jgi:hypothetical protein
MLPAGAFMMSLEIRAVGIGYGSSFVFGGDRAAALRPEIGKDIDSIKSSPKRGNGLPLRERA